MVLRSHPTTYAFATMPTLALFAALVVLVLVRTPFTGPALVLGWAVWEGSVARELAALAGGPRPVWGSYRRTVVASSVVLFLGTGGAGALQVVGFLVPI